MEENEQMSNFSKETILLFDNVCDTIVKEKGYIGDVEIEELVSLLRIKIKKLQTTYSDSAIAVSSLEEFHNGSSMLNLEASDKSETMKALDVITDTVSNYLIHEKGVIIEKDFQDITNHLKIITSLSKSNTKVLSHSCIKNSSTFTKEKNSLKSVSETSTSLMKEKPLDKRFQHLMKNINRKKDEHLLNGAKKNKLASQKIEEASHDISLEPEACNNINKTIDSKCEIIHTTKLPRSTKMSSLNTSIKQSRVPESVGNNSKPLIYEKEKNSSLINRNELHLNMGSVKSTSLIPSRINNMSQSTSRMNSSLRSMNIMNKTFSSTSRINNITSSSTRGNNITPSSSKGNNVNLISSRMNNISLNRIRMNNTSSSTSRINKPLPNLIKMNQTCQSTSTIIKPVPGSEKEEKKCLPNSSIQVLKGATNKFYSPYTSRKPQKAEASSGNIRRSRSKWVYDKSRFTIFTTEGNESSSAKYSGKETCNLANNMNEDTTQKILFFFKKVVDAILLEELEIKDSDVDCISRILNKYACTKKKNYLPEFSIITSDMPTWALRGFIKKKNSNSVIKTLQPLLNKMVDFVVYTKDRMMPSDVKNFCSILRKEIPFTCDDSKSKSFSIKDSIAQKHQINLKDNRPVTRSLVIKPNTNISNIRIEKSTVLPHNFEKVPTSTTNFRYATGINPHPSEQKEFVDAAIEEGIRSLEYIKRLSEKLLDDLDKNAKNNVNKNRLSMTRFYQNDHQCLNKRICKSAASRIESHKMFKKNNSDNIFQETTESIKQKIQNIRNDCKNTYNSLKEVQESCVIKEKNRNLPVMNITPGSHDLLNKVKIKNSSKEPNKHIENKNNFLENTSSTRPKSFMLSNKVKTEIKKSMRPQTPKESSLLLPSHSINQSSKFRIESQILKEEKLKEKLIIRKTDEDKKENINSNKLRNKETNVNDKQHNEKQRNQTLLKTSRTYSVFRPFNAKDNRKNNTPQNTIIKENETHHSTDLNQKRLSSKIPVSTIYHNSLQSPKK